MGFMEIFLIFIYMLPIIFVDFLHKPIRVAKTVRFTIYNNFYCIVGKRIPILHTCAASSPHHYINITLLYAK